MYKFLKAVLAILLLLTTTETSATKFISLRVIDKDYLMIQFRDGEVHYRDNGTGQSAYLGHSFSEGDDTLFVFGERLKVAEAQTAGLWQISSPDDKLFATAFTAFSLHKLFNRKMFFHTMRTNRFYKNSSSTYSTFFSTAYENIEQPEQSQCKLICFKK